MLVSRLVLNLRGYRSLKELSTASTTPTAAETLTSIPELSFAPCVNDDRGHGGRLRRYSVRGHGDGSPQYDYESSRLWGNIGAPLETGFGDYVEEPSVPLKTTGAGAGTELIGTGREGYYEAVAVGSPGPHQSERGVRGRGPDTVRAPSVSPTLFVSFVSCVRWVKDRIVEDCDDQPGLRVDRGSKDTFTLDVLPTKSRRLSCPCFSFF